MTALSKSSGLNMDMRINSFNTLVTVNQGTALLKGKISSAEKNGWQKFIPLA